MAAKKSKKKSHKKHGKKKAHKKTGKKKAHKKSSKKKAGGWRQHSMGHDSVAAHMSAANKRGAGFGVKVTAHSLLSSAKKRSGKRWTCGGPVRSGCGGSNSRVIKTRA